jgi:RND family efflux transporter MFP subunit
MKNKLVFSNQNSKRYLKYYLYFLFSVYLAGCGSSDTYSDSSDIDEEITQKTRIVLTASQIESTGIKTVVVEEREIGIPLELPGHVEPVPGQEAYVTTLITGRVEQIYVLAGDRVKSGQALIHITGSELGSYIANLRNTWVELDRQNRFTERGVGIPKKLQDARIAYAAARQQILAIGYSIEKVDQISKTDTDIEGMILSAPIAGIVLEQNAVMGGPVAPGDMLMHIAQLKPIWLEVDVYEKNLNDLKPGLSVQIIPVASIDTSIEGEILKIIPKIDSERRTARVIIQVPNTNEELKPGMFVTAQVMTSLQKINAVPAEAILVDGETSFVLIAENDSTFRRMEIKARPEGAIYVAVPEIASGTQVVTTGVFQIMSAMKGVEAESD